MNTSNIPSKIQEAPEHQGAFRLGRAASIAHRAVFRLGSAIRRAGERSRAAAADRSLWEAAKGDPRVMADLRAAATRFEPFDPRA